METPKKWLAVSLVTIICLAIALTACLFWIGSLSNRITLLEFEHEKLSDSVWNLTRKQDMLEADLDEMIREAGSLVEELDCTIIGSGIQPNTAAYQLTLIPKELAEDTAVKITVGNTTVPFSRNGDTFTGTVDIPLFEENEDYPVLTVTSAGITKRDELEEINLWYAYSDWLPYLFLSMSGTGSAEDPEETAVYLAYGFRSNDFYTNTPVSFTKITMTKIVNGEEGLCQDVTNQLRDTEGVTDFNTEFTVSNSDRVTVVIRAEDSQGYIHEVTSHCQYETESGCVVVTHDDAEQIYAPDGRVLYTAHFEDLT